MLAADASDRDDAGTQKRGTRRGRLAVSFAVGVALGFAWGPFCALVGVFRCERPDIFFSPSHYLLASTLVTLGVAVACALAFAPTVALITLVYRYLGEHARNAFFIAGACGVAVLTLRQLDVIPRPPIFLLLLFLVWCVAGALFRLPAIQLAVFPMALVAPLLRLQGIIDPVTVGFVCFLVAFAAHRFTRPTRAGDAALDTIGMMLAVAVPVAVLVHVRAGHFVFALDAPHLLAFAGLLFLTIGALLIARRVADRKGTWAITPVSCGLIAIALGLCWAQRPPAPPTSALAHGDRPNIILIVWDTARAEQFHQHGYARSTTPVWDEVAARGALFERAIAPSCWTLPTHASMFTGLWPRTHSATNGGYRRLGEQYDTIAELLSQAGYETIGLVGNEAYAGRKAGIAQGFEAFYEPRISAEMNAPQFAETVNEWLYRHDDGSLRIQRGLRRWLFLREPTAKPLFVFVNLLEPHGAYTPRKDLVEMSPGATYAEAVKWNQGLEADPRVLVEGPAKPPDRERAWQALEDLYDAEIRYTDQCTGKLLQLLLGPDYGGEDNTLVILTSDHGEHFGEHGRREHMFTVYEQVTHVPLALSWPGRIPPGGRVGETVSTIGLFATIAEAARLPTEAYRCCVAPSLLGACCGAETAGPTGPLVCEAWPLAEKLGTIAQTYCHSSPMGRFIAPLLAVYDGQWKYIRGLGQNRELLYNLVQDPKEAHDLSAQEPGRCADMRLTLDRWLAETPSNMPTFADGYEKGPLR